MRSLFYFLSFLLASPCFAADKEPTLDAPGLLVAYSHSIDLQMNSVRCGPTYRFEVSLDGQHWKYLRTTTFGTMGGPPPDEQRCIHDLIDSETPITKKTKAVYYRYVEVEHGKIIHRSAIGKIEAKDLEGYWDAN